MSNLYSKIANLCKENKTNITAMCRDLDITRSSLTELKKGRSRSLSSQSITSIASYFGVSPYYLLEDNKDELQNLPSSVGEFLKEARGDHSIIDIAALAGISVAELESYESNLEFPRSKMLVKIANAYGVDYRTLMLTVRHRGDSGAYGPGTGDMSNEEAKAYFSIMRTAKERNISPDDLKKIIDIMTSVSEKKGGDH